MQKQTIEYEDGRTVELDEDDVPELTKEDFKRMRPAREVLPPAFMKAWEDGRVGRPVSENPKQQLTVRLDTDVVAWLKAGGSGYQTRLNSILRQVMQQ
jgi:uncharacterized protein (DUF4415 family)